jgi:3-deoxy-D-glycero-D-galacto-nononate 9-phosphatase
MNIKLVITDIDGVWTDGGMYYSSNGDETKKFNTSDSAGVLFLKHNKIPLAIMTGENSVMVTNRAEKLEINHVFLGVKDKLSCAKKLCEKLGISLNEVAFIGDDINDIKLLKSVAYSASPNNTPDYIKSEVDLVLKVNGGNGAFRNFVEILLDKLNMWENTKRHFTEI